MMKFRASYGEIGDDNLGDPFDSLALALYEPVGIRWQHSDGSLTIPTVSTHGIVRHTLGNKNVKWETVKKANFGIDYGFLGGLITGSLDFFQRPSYRHFGLW